MKKEIDGYFELENLINNEENIVLLKNILNDFNDNFTPRLSEKIKNFDDYAKKLLNDAIFYQIKKEDKNIGLLAFYINKKTKISYLTLIAIKNEYQGYGFGKKLLEMYENISKKEKMDILKLEVFDKNIKAVNFYRKFGFKYFKRASKETSYMIKEINKNLLNDN